jgi:hypothetical protein
VLSRFTRRYPTAEAAGQACALQMSDVLAPLSVDGARLHALLASSPHDHVERGERTHAAAAPTPLSTPPKRPAVRRIRLARVRSRLA